MRSGRFHAALLLGFLPLASMAAEAPADLPSRIEHYHIDYHLDDKAAAVITRSWSAKVLKTAAVDGARSSSISYSTSIESAEVLEAYTRKADGRRIDSQRSNFQLEVNQGQGEGAPAFSDRTSLTAVFPEVEVGDTVVFSYRITQKEPMFPGRFSVMDSFSRQVAYDDVRVRIDAPAGLWAQYEAPGMTQDIDERKDGRRVLQWRYRNPQPLKSKRRDYSVFDPLSEPGFAYSTFRSYEEIAQAYAERARPKAVVDERIRKLAEEIAPRAGAPREQARALYDWVATNISYAGNCIGIGAVVPRDVGFVLDNRMGDCKDHATLLQALLTAKGIASTQALVNAGAGYRLPKTPVVAYVNHVINYIPSLDLYADSTAAIVPFGMLPYQVQGKPALLTDGFSDSARTPVLQPGTNRQRVVSKLKIDEEGAIAGEVKVGLEGMFAVMARAQFRDFPEDREAELVENMFRGWGLEGSGSFRKDDAKALGDRYNYEARVEVKDFVQPGTGALTVAPLLLSQAPVALFLGEAAGPDPEQDVFCSNGYSEEEYSISLPKGMQIVSLPEKAEISNSFASYSASYRMKGRELIVRRVFDDRTLGNVCTPKVMAEYQKFLRRVQQSYKSQVIYKR